uniref:Uncharacterized protein n=1 Tax=Aegilops tauschii TaxID=37682 RepID=M8CHS1_AEGTA
MERGAKVVSSIETSWGKGGHLGAVWTAATAGGRVLPTRGGGGRGAHLAGGPVLLEEAGAAELKHGHDDPPRQMSLEKMAIGV